jgi:hypothetical protein
LWAARLRRPTSALRLPPAPSSEAQSNCASWCGSRPSPGRCALPWSCVPPFSPDSSFTMIPGFGLPSSLGRGQVLVGRVVLSREESSSSPVMWGRPRPSLQGGGGPVDLVSSREAGEEVPGSESPALSPLPASSPFRSAPGPRHLVVGGRLRCFLPFWKAELELSTQLLRAVGDFQHPSTFQPPLRSRECAFRLPLKAPSSVSSIQRWQLCSVWGP